MSFSDEGVGTPVVLLHAGLKNRGQWRSLHEKLVDSYRVIAPDLIGHGGTFGWSPDRRFSIADEWRATTSVLESLKGKFHLVGHSYGGIVALHGALRAPQRVLSLTLIEPTTLQYIGQGEDPSVVAAVREIRERLETCPRDQASEPFARWFMDYWVGEGTWEGMSPNHREALRAALPLHALGGVAMFNESARIEDLNAFMPPTLLLRGGSTQLVPHHVIDILHSALPHSTLHEVRGAGHMLPITHATEVNQHICEQLARVDREGESRQDAL